MRSVIFRSLRYKILAGYIVLVLLLTIVGVLAVTNFWGLQKSVTGITERNYRSVVAVRNMVAALGHHESAQLHMLLGETELAQEIYSGAQADFLAWFSRAADNITEPGEENIISELRSEYSRYNSLFAQLQELTAKGDTTAARELYHGQADPQFKRVRSLLDSLQDLNNTAFLNGNQKIQRDASEATWATILISSLAIILGLMLGLGLSEAIVRPIRRLTDTVCRISEGNLHEEIPVKGEDEVSLLAHEFNQMVKRIRTYEESNLGQLLAERRKSDTIVRVISEPVLVLDEYYRLLLVNPAAEALFTIDEHLVQRKPFLQVINRSDIFLHLQSALDDRNENKPDDQITIALNDRHYEMEIVLLEASNQVPKGLLVVFRDVTRFKELDELRSQFAATVSHEFRTPLTTLTMGLGMLVKHPAITPESSERHMIEAMNEEVERLTKLVHDLLDVSRLEAGRIQLEYQDTPVTIIMEQAVKLFAEQAKEKQIAITVTVDPDDIVVHVDPNQILMVLTNLIGNALRYTVVIRKPK